MAYKWHQVQEKLPEFSPALVNPKDVDNFKLDKTPVNLTCPFDGKVFSPKSLMPFFYGNNKSCGCLRKISANKRKHSSKLTYGEAKLILEARNLTLLNIDGLSSNFITKITSKGAHRVRCHCGTVFGQDCTLYHILIGFKKDCGCSKEETRKRASAARIGVITAAQKKANDDRRTITCDDLSSILNRYGSRVKNPFVGKISGRKVIECICKCGNIFLDKAEFIKKKNRIGSCNNCSKVERGRRRRGIFTPAMRAARIISAQAAHSVSYLDLVEAISLNGGLIETPQFDGFIKYLTPIDCICKCGTQFTSMAGDIKRGNSKSCSCLKSSLEKEIFNFVKGICPDAVKNTYKIIKNYDDSRLQLDVYVESEKFAIELDGLRWHGEFFLEDEGRKGYHLNSYLKHEICKGKGIRLLTIFEDEWLEKEETVKGFIRSILGKKETVGARECSIVAGGLSFIEDFHIQGAIKGETTSLIHNNKTVAAISFSKCSGEKAGQRSGIYELTRYCVGVVSVQGGLSKLIKHFWKTHPDAKGIISYSDNRLSAGGIYKKVGFVQLNESKPSYAYVFGRTRRHRFRYRKESLRKMGWLQDGETERICMKRMGYDRVWDCGKIKWGLERPSNL
jgi:hypothetical protein